MPDGTCSIDGCDKPVKVKARGWCGMHYMRWHTHGDPLHLATKVRGICAVEGCGRPAEARGWCQGHHVRWKKTGDVQANVPIRGRAPRACSLPDCGEPHSAKGLCNLHYKRLWKTGTTDGPPQYGDTCSIEDCDRPSWVKGLCQRCYMRVKARQWRAEHPGYDAEAHSAWRAANIEESRRRARDYAKTHPETKRAVEARRQERLRRSQDERIDYEKVLAEHGMVCHICWWDITSRDDLHFDHVVPLARGGTHTYDNIKPAHSGCNRWKHARLMSEL